MARIGNTHGIRLRIRPAAGVGHRARRRRDRVGCAHACGVGQLDDATDVRGQRRLTARQGQRQVIAAHVQGLRRRVIDQAPRRRIEERVAHGARCNAVARELEHAARALEADARGERRRARLRGLGGDEQRRFRGGLRAGGDREVEAERAFLGNADALAHQPGRIARDREAIAWLERRGRRHRHREGGRALVAEIDQRAERQPMGGAERQLTGARAVGQAQGQLGGLAGIARVGPIGVPALREFLVQRDAERLAGGDRVDVADQPHLGLRRAHGIALGGKRRNRGQDGQQDEDPTHHGRIKPDFR